MPYFHLCIILKGNMLGRRSGVEKAVAGKVISDRQTGHTGHPVAKFIRTPPRALGSGGYMTTSINSAKQQSDRSLWQGLVGIIDRPRVTFQSMLQREDWRRWAVPLLLYLVAFAVLTAVQTPYLRELALQQADLQLADLPADQADAARATMEFTMSLPFMLATGIIFGGLVLLIGVLAQTAYLYLSAMLAGGRDAGFKTMFTVSVWSRIPLTIGYLVQAAFVAVSQGALRYPGLAPLVASGNQLEDAGNPLVALLARVDLFWLWHLVLVSIGLALAARLSRGKSIVLTAVYAGLALAMALIPALLGRLFGG